MIQFNLLPDVKLEYIKTRRTKRLTTLVSLVAAGGALTVLLLLFLSVQVIQHKHLDDISKDIRTEVSNLNKVEDLNKMLTIQNQLTALPEIHAKEPVSSRLFGYIQQTTPIQANISNMEIDFSANTLRISGNADSLATANKYADSLKFATYKTSTTDKGKPFSNIVTTLTGDGKKATYTLSCNFDPILFSNAEVPVLTVPQIISTRSETEKPAAVFKAITPTTGGN